MKTHGTFNTQYNKKYVLFFVNEGTGYGEVDGLYQPISEPLYAIYNDYGTFEFEEKSLAAFIKQLPPNLKIMVGDFF